MDGESEDDESTIEFEIEVQSASSSRTNSLASLKTDEPTNGETGEADARKQMENVAEDVELTLESAIASALTITTNKQDDDSLVINLEEAVNKELAAHKLDTNQQQQHQEQPPTVMVAANANNTNASSYQQQQQLLLLHSLVDAVQLELVQTEPILIINDNDKKKEKVDNCFEQAKDELKGTRDDAAENSNENNLRNTPRNTLEESYQQSATGNSQIVDGAETLAAESKHTAGDDAEQQKQKEKNTGIRSEKTAYESTTHNKSAIIGSEGDKLNDDANEKEIKENEFKTHKDLERLPLEAEVAIVQLHQQNGTSNSIDILTNNTSEDPNCAKLEVVSNGGGILTDNEQEELQQKTPQQQQQNEMINYEEGDVVVISGDTIVEAHKTSPKLQNSNEYVKSESDDSDLTGADLKTTDCCSCLLTLPLVQELTKQDNETILSDAQEPFSDNSNNNKTENSLLSDCLTKQKLSELKEEDNADLALTVALNELLLESEDKNQKSFEETEWTLLTEHFLKLELILIESSIQLEQVYRKYECSPIIRATFDFPSISIQQQQQVTASGQKSEEICIHDQQLQLLSTANENKEEEKNEFVELTPTKDEREPLAMENNNLPCFHPTNEHSCRQQSALINAQTQTNVQEPTQVNISIEDAKHSCMFHNNSNSSNNNNMEQFQETDLEWEFDNEPAFERRQIQVKRNTNVRKDYELADELGRGKFGTVYRCQELATGKKLAAKFVHLRRHEDREDVEREIYIMSLLQHKRLLQLYDAFDDGRNEMCLVCELVDGGELFERVIDDDFELTERKAAIFVRQIVEGVEYMHSQSIVHLDLKPENILCVSKSGNRVKLIDFGLARQLQPGEQLRVMFGTPDFAAPEVLAYDVVSLATDMWSVGVICYVLLSGLSPFMGDNDMETMANVTRATFDFDDVSFDPISDLAKEFISSLLVRDQTKRLKPIECLQHPWLERGGQQLEASVRRRESLRINNDILIQPQHDNNNNNNNSNINLDQQLSLMVDMDNESSVADEAFGTSTPPTVSLDKRNLKKYVVRRKWHKTVNAIMALGRMGANLRINQLAKG